MWCKLFMASLTRSSRFSQGAVGCEVSALAAVEPPTQPLHQPDHNAQWEPVHCSGTLNTAVVHSMGHTLQWETEWDTLHCRPDTLRHRATLGHTGRAGNMQGWRYKLHFCKAHFIPGQNCEQGGRNAKKHIWNIACYLIQCSTLCTL